MDRWFRVAIMEWVAGWRGRRFGRIFVFKIIDNLISEKAVSSQNEWKNYLEYKMEMLRNRLQLLKRTILHRPLFDYFRSSLGAVISFVLRPIHHSLAYNAITDDKPWNACVFMHHTHLSATKKSSFDLNEGAIWACMQEVLLLVHHTGWK